MPSPTELRIAINASDEDILNAIAEARLTGGSVVVHAAGNATASAADDDAPLVFDDKPVRLGAADRLDPDKYRRAKALAESRGVALIIDKPVDKFEPPAGSIIIPRGSTAAQYRALKAKAIAEGRAYLMAQE